MLPLKHSGRQMTFLQIICINRYEINLLHYYRKIGTHTSLADVKLRSRRDSNDDHLHGKLPCLKERLV